MVSSGVFRALLAIFLILAVCWVTACDDEEDININVERCDQCTDDDDVVTDDDDDDDISDDDDDMADDDDDDDTDTVTLDLIEGCNHFATSDECFLPYPSAFYQKPDSNSPTGVRVNYTSDLFDTAFWVPEIDMEPSNRADGVSPAGPILIHFGVDVAPEHLTTQHELYESHFATNPIALFDMEDDKRVTFMSEMDMNRNEHFPSRYALIVRPLEPMEMAHRHIVVLTNDLTDVDGNPFESPPAFAVLRDGIKTTNPEIEEIRDHYEDIFAFLEDHGYPRHKLLLAWDFMVASKQHLLGSVLTMREVALNEALGTGMDYTITLVEDDWNEWVARKVEGEFEVPNFLNDQSQIEYDEDYKPIRQPDNGWYEYTMVIPNKAVTQAQPLPLVIFGHGIFGNGRDYVNSSWAGPIISEMAEEVGAVVIATNWIGLSEGDLDLIIEQVIPDINNISLVTDRLQQSLINNLVMTELAIGALEDDPQVKVGTHDLIDENRVYYYGVSLGGIQGSSFCSISNRITRGVLAVPGSVWLNMIPRSVVWLPMKLYMDLLYQDPLLQQMGIAIIQTRFDHSDPVNLTRLLYKDPLPDAPPNKVVLLQEAIGDSQVPNMTTEMLARSIGVKQVVPGDYRVFGLDPVTAPTTEPSLVQYHLIDQTTGDDWPPEDNTPPDHDNNVHSDMVFLEHVLDQVTHFSQTGEVEQYCSGSCDPD